MDKISFDIVKMKEFIDRLQDDESIKLFQMRLDYLLNHDESTIMDRLISWKYDIKHYRFDDFSNLYNERPIVIVGAGKYGRMSAYILEKEGYNIYGFADNDSSKVGTKVAGYDVYLPSEIAQTEGELFWIISSPVFGGELYSQLIANRYAKREDIFFPTYGAIMGTCGHEYFDCPNISLEDGEIFVDLGMYDGFTSLEVARGCNYGKIIGFEADQYLVNKCRNNLASERDITIYPYAAWDKKELLSFKPMDSAGQVSEDGIVKVQGESLDNILKGEKVTFIKMDIEGAEAKALLGAKECIKLHKPKLAISLYHKPEDVYEIPQIIMDIRDDYKFYIRHYTSYVGGTCLYAY